MAVVQELVLSHWSETSFIFIPWIHFHNPWRTISFSCMSQSPGERLDNQCELSLVFWHKNKEYWRGHWFNEHITVCGDALMPSLSVNISWRSTWTTQDGAQGLNTETKGYDQVNNNDYLNQYYNVLRRWDRHWRMAMYSVIFSTGFVNIWSCFIFIVSVFTVLLVKLSVSLLFYHFH